MQVEGSSIRIVFSDANRYHRYPARVDYRDDHYWRHDPRHRDGVDYRDRETRDRFRPSPSPVVFRDPPPRDDRFSRGPEPTPPPKDRDNDRDIGRRERPERTEVAAEPSGPSRPEAPAPVISSGRSGGDRSSDRVTDRGRGDEVRVSRGGGSEEVLEGRSGRGGPSFDPGTPASSSRGRDAGPGRGKGRGGDDRR
ncbi:MAG: hypothetical protein BWY73_01055 [candidate division TA06 bacterium ADurb.Bin417]|uniref:Uncharacterized protein n=1 Tax=candidate division TA06 bacterium ADurb.Bin417 TaxID=1852828 RepID=A0A1V5MEM5_UNCT6|nr:MAG: hypothetical protein BWY73_01055 [candidate division TA06 bacterium ADurb.Bin417]